ncbi:hypothetical protein M1D55_19280 [Cupriavidus sp. JZ107]
MAAVNFFDNFETLWAQAGALEVIDENQYKAGWAYIGATPPSVEQFNKVQQLNDQKAAWLFAQMKELAERAGFDLTAATTDALTRGVSRLSASVVGMMRNGRMSIVNATQTASFTADELIVQAGLDGAAYRLANFNEGINLGITGAGGMDTGLAPASGFVAIYAIHNPTTGERALLGKDATNAVQPEVYTGDHMPAGFEPSALVSVWPTNATRQFALGHQRDREVFTAYNAMLSTTVKQTALTPLSVAAYAPPNAKTLSGDGGMSASVDTAGDLFVAGAPGGNIGLKHITQTSMKAGAAQIGTYSYVPVIEQQKIYYVATTAAGTMNATIYISSYTF